MQRERPNPDFGVCLLAVGLLDLGLLGVGLLALGLLALGGPRLPLLDLHRRLRAGRGEVRLKGRES